MIELSEQAKLQELADRITDWAIILPPALQEANDMASAALMVAPTAAFPTMSRRIYFQAKLFSDETVDEQRKRWRKLPAEERAHTLTNDYLELRRRKNELESKLIRIEQKREEERKAAIEALQRYRAKSVGLPKFQALRDRLAATMKEKRDIARRLAKQRSLKLQAERLVEQKEAIVDRAKAAKQEIKRDMIQQGRYAEWLEMKLERQQHFLDKCMTNLNKAGRVPTVRCIDCGQPRLLTEYQLRTVASGTRIEHWLINPFCRMCRKERQKIYEKQRRDRGKVTEVTPQMEARQLSQMATAFVERLPSGAVDRIVDQLQREEEECHE